MEHLAPRKTARHLDQFLGSVQANGLVAQRLEIAEISARPAAQINDAKGGLALDRLQECCMVLADIVVSGAIPVGLGHPIVVPDRDLGNPP